MAATLKLQCFFLPYLGVSLGTLILCKGSIYLYKQLCDTFKQNWVADTSTHKVFNSTILNVLLKLNVWGVGHIWVEDMIK